MATQNARQVLNRSYQSHTTNRTNRISAPLLIAIGIAFLSFGSRSSALAGSKSKPFIPAQGSTSPSNGDLNPYGLAVVPNGFPAGMLQPGQLLVSNFNDSGNIQGNGSTIVIIDPATGQQASVPFFQGSGLIGFTNALGIVKAGFVFAGSVTSTPANGGLLVIDSSGKLVTTIKDGTNGPWGLAINNQGKTAAQLFISNVLDGIVTRLQVSFQQGFSVIGTATTIGAGYAFGLDSVGLVVGPAGLAYDSDKDVLYVASEDDNEIFAIVHAASARSSSSQGTLVYADNDHLHGPLGLMIAPNGNLVTANADPAVHVDPLQPSELVEFTTSGQFVRQFSIDPNTGSAFAILNVASGGANQFAYVDDTSSTLSIVRFAK
jgi:hypothetical protein